MFHILSRGEKFDIVKLRKHCTELGFRDSDIEVFLNLIIMFRILSKPNLLLYKKNFN